MKQVTVSAPGKLMLFGEHAVLYGEPCLVTAVDIRLEVTLETTDTDLIAIINPYSKNNSFVSTALEIFAQKYLSHKIQGIKISTKSPFSGKYGFGSSSAVTVAVCKALSVYYEKPLTPRELFDLSYKVMIAAQGVGSGFDVASACFGGTLYFKQGGEILELLETDLQKTQWIIGYSGVKSNTVDLIKQVASLRSTHMSKFEFIMSSIGDIVRNAKKSILAKNWEKVGYYMDSNQELLRELGISTKQLEIPIKAAKKAGALGAKLSGAGGGDCMIALTTPDNNEKVIKAITEAGAEVVSLHLGASGARTENARLETRVTNGLHASYVGTVL